MPIFQFKKLVRDKVAELIEANGSRASFRVLSDTDYIQELKKKLIEEAEEVLKEESTENIIKELADVQEVIDNILAAVQTDKSTLEMIQTDKNSKKGSFARRIFIDEVNCDEKDPWYNYFKFNPDKYPPVD